MRLVCSAALGALVLLAGCGGETRPRPRGFHRLELPPHTYVRFESPECPFTFEYPAHGRVDARRIDSCFVDISFPALAAKWHITSRPLDKARRNPVAFAYEDYRGLIYKHAQKASEIFESRLQTPNGGGTLFEIYGEVPTSAQVFFTDSTTHAVMTSFYFNTAMRNDSLAPVIDYMKQDLQHMVRTLRWRGGR